jgi:hypothetical protein
MIQSEIQTVLNELRMSMEFLFSDWDDCVRLMIQIFLEELSVDRFRFDVSDIQSALFETDKCDCLDDLAFACEEAISTFSLRPLSKMEYGAAIIAMLVDVNCDANDIRGKDLIFDSSATILFGNLNCGSMVLRFRVMKLLTSNYDE